MTIKGRRCGYGLAQFFFGVNWLCVAPALHAAPWTLGELAWKGGIWRADTAERQIEERWAAGPGGVLFGSSWAKAGGKPAFIEAMIVSQNGMQVVMRLRHFARDLSHSVEDIDSPMTFALASCGSNIAVFEGEGNKTGERMTYQRNADQLSFTGDFLRDGEPFRVKVDFRRTPD